MVETVDRWAATCGTNVVGQIGPSTYKPAHIKAHNFLPPKEFESLLKQADLVIAHCGMGSILSALSLGKPIIVMPRSASKGEHRNDHQFATAQRLSRQPGVTVAWDEAEMSRCLERISALQDSSSFSPIPPKAPRELTDRLRTFLWEGRR
ncbi:MAG TPA: glycosyltransferase [Sphingomicrobium sp.]|nr:glycosyltransferase [Sphingomicrobium sp.]